MHLVRMWHTRALENFAGPSRSGHPLVLGVEMDGRWPAGQRHSAPSPHEAPRSGERVGVRGRALSGHHFLDYGDGQLGGPICGTADGGFEVVAEFHVNRSETRLADSSLARLV